MMSHENTKESQQSGMCNVQVAVRCRPVNGEERRTNQPTVVSCESEAKTIKVNYGAAGKKSLKQFNFDKVFGMYSTQVKLKYDKIILMNYIN
jgi:kinesin family protein 11